MTEIQCSLSLQEDSDEDVVFLKEVNPSESRALHAEAPCKGDGQVNLFSLIDDILHKILSFLSYDEIAKLRLVNTNFYSLFQFCFTLNVVGESTFK